MQKTWLLLLLIALGSNTCRGSEERATGSESFSIQKLVLAVQQLDKLLAEKRGDEVFAINASKTFKRNIIKPAFDAVSAAISAAETSRIGADLEILKNDGVLSNWRRAVTAGWVEVDPAAVTEEQRKAIGNIMTIYSGNADRVLEVKIMRIIEHDYLALLDMNKKVKECLIFFLGAQNI